MSENIDNTLNDDNTLKCRECMKEGPNLDPITYSKFLNMCGDCAMIRMNNNDDTSSSMNELEDGEIKDEDGEIEDKDGKINVNLDVLKSDDGIDDAKNTDGEKEMNKVPPVDKSYFFCSITDCGNEYIGPCISCENDHCYCNDHVVLFLI